ncbi:MAG: polysaccharide biosynthesis/export family protein [Candidatus Sulfotelmatobacter sp.]
MEFGRFHFASALSLLALFLISLSNPVFKAMAQQTAAAAPAENTKTALPPAQPLAQAAVGIGRSNASSPAPNSSTGIVASSADPGSSSLKLGPGDLIDVAVYNVPELTTKARIGNSGDVYLPLIDYVHIGDLTMEEAQALIEKRLESGGFVRNPHVTIFLDESASQGVTVLGEVARPGIYPAIGNRKLYDLISAAGGFSQSAGRKVSIIRQHSPDGPITLNLPRNLADDLQDNIEILPGDTITVPRAPIVYVVGEVGRPSGFLVDNGSLTVLQVLALAGGTNHTAKMSGTCIIRKGPNGMTSTKIPLKKMLEAKAPDLALQPDDILFVPLSGARVVASQSLSAAISTATGLAVIAAHP